MVLGLVEEYWWRGFLLLVVQDGGDGEDAFGSLGVYEGEDQAGGCPGCGLSCRSVESSSCGMVLVAGRGESFGVNENLRGL